MSPRSIKISIVTITLNDIANLEKTASSIINQTYKNIEWIIKDGNSSDGTKDYVDKLIKSQNYIIYINKKDSSLYDAMNQAFPLISGTYVLFLNSGDIFFSNDTLEKVVMSLNGKQDFDFVYGDNIDEEANGLKIYKRARTLDYLRHSIPTSHQAIFYNSAVINNYRYSTEFKVCSDYAFTAKIYYDGNSSYLKLPFPICLFSLGGVSQTNRKTLLIEGYQIHLNIVGDSLIKANLKLLKRTLTFLVLDYTPWVYRIARTLNDKYINRQ